MGWEVFDEVEPIALLHSKPLGVTLRVAYITIIYVSQKTQTVLGHSKATPVGIPCVRPQSDMMCYMLDLCDLGSGS